VAVAAGKIEPTGKVKSVQPLTTGKVSQILAHDGDTVAAGQTLAVLDATEQKGELDRLTNDEAASAADLMRLKAVLATLTKIPVWTSAFTVPPVNWSGTPPALQDAEEVVLSRDLEDLRAKLRSIESQIAQHEADLNAVAATIAAQEQLVSTLNTVASMRSELVDRQAGSKADWLAALQALQSEQVTLATHAAEKADDTASLNVLRQEGQETWTGFLADYAKSQSSTQLQLDDLVHKVAEAKGELDSMTLRSPIDGVVEDSQLTSIGQVVTTGEELLRVVPSDAPVVVRGFIPNDDIGFVKVGQPAVVKIEAFPFTEYGTVQGTVVALGKDALEGQSTPGASAGSPVLDATGPLLFPVTVELPSAKVQLNGTAVRLSPGMQVTAEIGTGRRRILEYLFAPIVEIGSSAFHER